MGLGTDCPAWDRTVFCVNRDRLRYLTHALAENRHGLIVDVETTQANGTAEMEAAKKMI